MKSRESQIYLDFFINSLPTILAFGLLTLSATLFYLNSEPNQFIGVEDWQMSYQDQNMGDRVNLTDQAVSLLRSKVLQSKIKINPGDDIKVFKSGPLLINLTNTGKDQSALKADIKNIDNYLISNFPLIQVGQPIYNLQPKPYLTLGFISFGLGSFFGLLVCLVKSYFKNY